MNTTKNHHAAIFTTPHQLHFLITGKCTFDTFHGAIYKPYLLEETVPLEMASFQTEEHDMNGRQIRFGEHTGEDGAILWHDEFSTVADASVALLEELRSVSEQIAQVSVLATAAAETLARSPRAEAPDDSVTYGAEEKKCSPRVESLAVAREDQERLDAPQLLTLIRQEVALLNRTLRRRFAARRRVELAAYMDNGLAFSWAHLNRKARDAVGAAAQRINGSDIEPICTDLRDALAFVRGLNEQLAQDDGRLGAGEKHVLGGEPIDCR